LLGLALFSILSAGLPAAHAEDERATKPTSVGLELFGRGILWDLHVDEVLSEELAAGIGFGSVGLKTPGGGDLNNSARLIPVYMNYYFMKEQGSVFATLGADLVLNQDQVANTEATMGGVKFNSSGVMPTFGVGYENRSPTGVILQVTAYGLVAKSFYPWFGFSLGFAF
jgi:hypothetical protein